MNIGVLILSHRGHSFVEQLSRKVRNTGVSVFVLSSAPTDKSSRARALQGLCDYLLFTEKPRLEQKDINDTLEQLRRHGFDISLCITVWEGYRTLMASTNRKLNKNDITPDLVDFLRDKYSLRTTLTNKGLSEVQVELASSDAVNARLEKNVRSFLKPRYGIASFGAQRLTQASDLNVLQNQLRQNELDETFVGVVSHDDFIVEDFIGGDEYSFEVIAVGGRVFLIATHLKVELTQREKTVEENACVSPPPAWTPADLKKAKRWLQTIFIALDIRWGCFHVEGKHLHEKDHYEVIEINPRIGGALISDSAGIHHHDISLLDLWLNALEEKSVRKVQTFLAEFEQQLDGENFSFFKVFFPTKPGSISSIKFNEIAFKPYKTQCLCSVGDKIKESHVEKFLCQILWKIPRMHGAEAINQLLKESNYAFESEIRDFA